MSRKPIEPNCPNRVLAPEGLSLAMEAAWRREFGQVPAGHFVQSDRAGMLDLCRLVVESDRAQARMEASPSTSSQAHWRQTMRQVQDARRALRLTPHARMLPRRAGLLAVGVSRDDAAAFDPPAHGAHDWRSLFPPGRLMPPPHGRKKSTDGN